MSAWRTGGVGPEKAGAGLRGIGFIALVIAFLAVSNQYVSDDGDKAPATTTSTGTIVLTVPALAPVLRQLGGDATVRTGSSTMHRTQIQQGRPADLFVTDVLGDAEALAKADRCSTPVPLATGPAPARTKYFACAASATGAGPTLLAQVAGLKARAALLDAGFDVPEQR